MNGAHEARGEPDDRMTLAADAERRLRELHTLKVIAETLNASLDLRQALDSTLKLLVEVMGLKTAWVFLTRPSGQGFTAISHYGLPPALQVDEERPLRHGSCYCQEMFLDGGLSHAVNIVTCSRLQEARGNKEGLVYHASVPLQAGDRALGILNVASPGRDLFTDEDLQLLSAAGYVIGTAVERTQLHEERRELAALEERHRLARDLHDSVTQTLFSMALTAEAARTLLPNDLQKADAALTRLQQMAQSALAEMRALIFQLRPARLDEAGLAAALRAHIEVMPRPGGLEVEFEVKGEERDLPDAVAQATLRIAQEALANVVKHARARKVRVLLQLYKRAAALRVADDGIGLADEPRPGRRGLGLSTMRERAEAIGARLDVSSKPGKGTEVSLWVPLGGSLGT